VAERFDVAVVGSGPSGSLAAERLLSAGLRVVMLDVGNDDDRYRKPLRGQLT
jgi:flavin-dependent dehydrogenase